MIRRTTILLLLLLPLVGGMWLYQRFIRFNAGVVVPGTVYRSAQPSPAYLEKAVNEYGLKSVINLQRYEQPLFRSVEQDKVEQLGARYIWLPNTNTRRPLRSEMLRLIEMVESAPRPLLVHCKTGADRTSVAAAMFAMHDLGKSFEESVSENVTLLHLHTGRPGDEINDIFDLYREAKAGAGLPTGGWTEFVEWIKEGYPPDYADARIEPAVSTLRIAPGETKPIRVVVTNDSRMVWPDEPGHPLVLVAHHESGDSKQRTFYANQPLRPKIAPGESQTIDLPITIPADPRLGVTNIRLDVLQTNKLFFSLAGERLVNVTLEVVPPLDDAQAMGE